MNKEVNVNITFIGGGNMASSLIGGLVPEQFQANQVTVYDINKQALDNLQQLFEVKTTDDLNPAVKGADIIVLAVKPQILQTVCRQIKATLNGIKPLFISIAAGIQAVDIDRWLGGQQSLVRCMPNTPSLYNYGASGLFSNEHVSTEQQARAQAIMQSVGIAVWVNSEQDLDIVTALSGSGPAYFFLFIESLQAAAEKLGLEKSVAKQLAAQTALGAAHMAIDSDDIEKLRNNVTSKGGTTEQALLSFEHNHLTQIVDQAVNAAYRRSQQMAQELSVDQPE